MDPRDMVGNVWRVKTENSTYLFDFELGVGMRIPNDPSRFEALRRDNDAYQIHQMGPIEIGKPMVMLITVEEGIVTQRTTSWVTAIAELHVGPDELREILGDSDG